IMGFDGIKLSKMIEPELTTVQQPIYEMGEKACKLIIKLIDSESNKDKSVYFEPEIVVGGTV
ncbi:MAG: substrate-binding domain-containing protein, partial [Clostridium butyricum]|nr:substrate-binding domain-containing protein [Clostridium butyricum]